MDNTLDDFCCGLILVKYMLEPGKLWDKILLDRSCCKYIRFFPYMVKIWLFNQKLNIGKIFIIVVFFGLPNTVSRLTWAI